MAAGPAGTGESDVFDLVVVGGGAAGLWTALRAAELGGRVGLVSRKPLSETSSYWAQGGLAAALEPGDSPGLHAEDTLRAGRGLCRRSAVEVLTSAAPGVVEDLLARGVGFDRDRDGQVELALEGGHSARRIVHAGGSSTGHELTRALTRMVSEHPGVEVIEETSVLSLDSVDGECLGVRTTRGSISASATVLATGGAAALWARSSNPWGAIGAGPVIAWTAGAELVDLEFCQFHPTCLLAPGREDDGSLISEALRGEGATLVDREGERFTDELAPRDDVSIAIIEQEIRQEGRPVRLDLTGVRPERFPTVFAMLSGNGFDPEREPVPVSPGAHYTMGGIRVDLDGRSSLPGLYAVGECACTGLHGANRLASNSLSECFVFGERTAAAALDSPRAPGETPLADGPPPDPDIEFDPPTEQTRERVWRLAGPLRQPEGLSELETDPYPLARLIARSARLRNESRGGHRRIDHPETDPGLDGIHLFVGADGEVVFGEWK